MLLLLKTRGVLKYHAGGSVSIVPQEKLSGIERLTMFEGDSSVEVISSSSSLQQYRQVAVHNASR